MFLLKLNRPYAIFKLVSSVVILILTTTTTSRLSRNGQFSQVLANNAVKYFSSIEASACDGQSMEIRCNEDYIIDVITVELTILNDTNSQQQLCSSSTAAASSLNNSNDENESSSSSHLTQTRANLLPLDSLGSRISGSSKQEALERTCSGAAREPNQASRDNITRLVNSLCWKTNSCTLDLTGTVQNADQISSSPMQANPSPVQASSSSSSSESSEVKSSGQARQLHDTLGKQQRMSLHLSQLIMQQSCPQDRKLLEVVYKCLPQKLKRAFRCKGSQLTLECPAEKRILVTWAEFGHLAQDKANDVCKQQSQLESNSNNNNNNHKPAPISAAPTPAPVASNKTSTSMGQCLSSSAYKAMSAECQLKRRCQLEVQPEVLGSPDCGQLTVNFQSDSSLPQYLRYTYFCANETLIQPDLLNHHPQALNESRFSRLLPSASNSNSSSSASRVLPEVGNTTVKKTPTTRVMPQASPGYSMVTNQTSNTLYSSSSTGSSNSNSNSSSYPSRVAGGYPIDESSARSQASLAGMPASGISDISNTGNLQLMALNEDTLSSSLSLDLSQAQVKQRGEDSNKKILELVLADPNLNQKRPIDWSNIERIRLLARHFSHELVVLVCLITSSIMLACLVRQIRFRRTRNGRPGDAGSQTGSSASSMISSNSISNSKVVPPASMKQSSSDFSSGSLSSSNQLKRNTLNNNNNNTINYRHESFTSSGGFPMENQHQHHDFDQPPPQPGMQQQQQNQYQHHHHSRPFNSCSESYFSLDEFSGQNLAGQARPRLWTIYNPSQPHQQHQHQAAPPYRTLMMPGTGQARTFFPVAPPMLAPEQDNLFGQPEQLN